MLLAEIMRTDKPLLQNYSIADSGRNKRTLAREWGVEPSTVTKWLHGASLPKPDRVYRLADFFGCSMDFLLGRTDAA